MRLLAAVVLLVAACGSEPEPWEPAGECPGADMIPDEVQGCDLRPEDWCRFCQDHYQARDYGVECLALQESNVAPMVCSGILQDDGCSCPQ